MSSLLRTTAKPRRSLLRRREAITGYLFIAPMAVLFLVFSVYPFARTFELSFTNWNGLSVRFDFVGLTNYLAVFGDGLWWKSIGNGLILSVAAIVLMQGLGLALALALNRRIVGGIVYRAIFYLPPILSGIVVAVIWKWLLEPTNGVINATLHAIGLDALAKPWLGDPETALAVIAVVSIWQGVGYPFLLFLAGLQSIPDEVVEAARVDGAGPFRIFWSITLPLLRPIAAVVTVLTFLGAMQTFNLVVAMTNGGPGYATEVPILHIYRAAFGTDSNFGYASALSIIFGVLLFAVSMFATWLSRRGSGVNA